MDETKPQQPAENIMGILPEGKLLVKLAPPMMISMLVQALYNVVDSFFVSRISQDAFNAVSLAFPLQLLIVAVGGGTAVGINALLSRSLGEKNQVVVDRTANTAVVLSLLSSIVFCVLGLTCSEAFFRAQTDVEAIVAGGTVYCQICLGLSVGLFFQFCAERLLQSTGRMMLAMATQLIGAILNTILDPLLIFGLLGFPKLGVAGAAVATVTGQIIAAAFGMYFNLRYNEEIHIRLRELRLHRETVREVYRIGVPSIIMQSIGSVMVFGMNKILISFTTAATAVFGAYFKLQSFIFMPVFGLNNALVPIVAYNYGVARPKRVKKTIRLGVAAAVSIMLLGFTIFQIFPDLLLKIFDADAEMLRIGVPALRTISFAFLFAGFCIIAGSVCQAIGNPFYSLILSVSRQLVVLLPAAYLLSLSGDVNMVWYSFPIAEIVAVLLSAVYLRRTLRAMDRRIGDTESAG